MPAHLLLLAHYVVHVFQLLAVGFCDSGRHAPLVFLQSGQEINQQPREMTHEMKDYGVSEALQCVPIFSRRKPEGIQAKNYCFLAENMFPVPVSLVFAFFTLLLPFLYRCSSISSLISLCAIMYFSSPSYGGSQKSYSTRGHELFMVFSNSNDDQCLQDDMAKTLLHHLVAQ